MKKVSANGVWAAKAMLLGVFISAPSLGAWAEEAADTIVAASIGLANNDVVTSVAGNYGVVTFDRGTGNDSP